MQRGWIRLLVHPCFPGVYRAPASRRTDFLCSSLYSYFVHSHPPAAACRTPGGAGRRSLNAEDAILRTAPDTVSWPPTLESLPSGAPPSQLPLAVLTTPGSGLTFSAEGGADRGGSTGDLHLRRTRAEWGCTGSPGDCVGRGGPGSLVCWCSVTQLCLTLCNPMDCSTPGFPVHHCL